MSKPQPQKNHSTECFNNNQPPQNGDAAIDRIVQMITATILDEGEKLDDSTFPVSVRDTWHYHWGHWAKKHYDLKPGAWDREWKNVAVIATVQGCRAVDLARERGRKNGVTEADFIEAGTFSARCCKRCYFESLGGHEACWCTDC